MTFSKYHEKAKIKSTLFSLLFAVVLCNAVIPVHAACKAPKPPELPDAKTAVLAQMVKAKKEVKVYMGSAKAFLACTHSDSKHDRVVTQMRQTAKQFNKIVKAYKSRVKRA